MTVMTMTTSREIGGRRIKGKEEKEECASKASYSTPKSVSYLVTPPEDVTSGTSERYRDLNFKTKI